MRHALHPYPYTTHRSVGLRLGGSVDSLFNELVRQFDEPAVKGEWTDEGLTLTVDLPGISAEGVDVAVAERVITVSVDELGWKRSLRLRPNLDTDSITARHLDGRLTIHVGFAAAAEARSISIDTTTPVVEALEVSNEDAADSVETSPEASDSAE